MSGNQSQIASKPATDHGQGDRSVPPSSSPLLCLGRAESGAGLTSPANVRWSARSVSAEATTTVPYGAQQPGRLSYSSRLSPSTKPQFLGRELDSGGRRVSHPDVFQRPVYQAGVSPRPVLSPPRRDDQESSSIP